MCDNLRVAGWLAGWWLAGCLPGTVWLAGVLGWRWLGWLVAGGCLAGRPAVAERRRHLLLRDPGTSASYLLPVAVIARDTLVGVVGRAQTACDVRSLRVLRR